MPYEFRERQHGESKLDTRIAWEYMMLIADKLIGHIVPVRFALFALVGSWTVHPHDGPLGCAHHRRRGLRSGAGLCCGCSDDIEFLPQQSLHLSTAALRGLALLRGLFTFYAICALGTVANVGIAGYVFSKNEVWWLAGLAGVVVGSVWNYAVSSVFTWKQK